MEFCRCTSPPATDKLSNHDDHDDGDDDDNHDDHDDDKVDHDDFSGVKSA